MGRNTKYSKELKLEIIERYLSGESATILANEYRLPSSYKTEIINWAREYEVLGNNAFEETTTNKSYSRELKLKIIKEYLNGEGSFRYLALKYNISSHKIVRKWVLKYNNGVEIRDYNPKGDV